jgi:hypothetical protein
MVPRRTLRRTRQLDEADLDPVLVPRVAAAAAAAELASQPWLPRVWAPWVQRLLSIIGHDLAAVLMMAVAEIEATTREMSHPAGGTAAVAAAWSTRPATAWPSWVLAAELWQSLMTIDVATKTTLMIGALRDGLADTRTSIAMMAAMEAVVAAEGMTTIMTDRTRAVVGGTRPVDEVVAGTDPSPI